MAETVVQSKLVNVTGESNTAVVQTEKMNEKLEMPSTICSQETNLSSNQISSEDENSKCTKIDNF